jgi:glycosyltransferase involved in cell wall biosynthesis
VEDGQTGFIVPAGDAPSLAEAILRFASNPDLAPAMAPACRAAVTAYSVATLGQRLVAITEKHLERRRLLSAF